MIELNKQDRILLIVESPNKVKTISSILKELGYKNIIVQASVGHISHIKDSGDYNIGVDLTNFKIDFEISPDKREVVSKLKEQVRLSKYVLLGTDPDREGEAIAWSLKKFLNIPDNKCARIFYHEITKPAIEKALNNLTEINDELVEAAQTRNSLDKIVGYRLSPLARQQVNARSVGRCQSAGLKLVVDKEKEIQNFKVETYYELYLNFKKNKNDFKAKYIGDDKKDINKFKSRDECEKIGKDCYQKPYSINNTETKELNQNAPLPFITSTYQQEVSSKLGVSVKDAMAYAQKLFEGIEINGKHVALTTYLRTDDTTIAPEFIPEIKKYIEKEFGKKYIGTIKSKKSNNNAQGGHECFRVIDLSMTPERVKNYINDPKLIKVYDLIYRRTIASVMSTRKISDTQYTIVNGKHRFLLSSKEELFDGWKAIYNYQDDKEKEEVLKETFKKNEELKDTKLESVEKTTQPPTRFTEASLIKTLDKLGIGRPSTYATIISTLLDPTRNYCKVENKKMVPTDLAFKLVDFLDNNFNEIVDSSYTAGLEKSLDKIADGKLTRVEFLKAFYSKLSSDINKILPEDAERVCPECGNKLVIRRGKYGMFWGCSNYPKCHHIENLKKSA